MYNNSYNAYNNGFYRPNNSYAQRLSALEQQQASMYQQPQQSFNPQPIQSMNQIQPQAVCYFVANAGELSNLNIMPNTFFLGLNTTAKEIYVRRMNNDGNIEVETYTLASGTQEKKEYELIMEQLIAINQKLATPVKENNNDERNVRSTDRPNDAKQASRKSSNESF